MKRAEEPGPLEAESTKTRATESSRAGETSAAAAMRDESVRVPITLVWPPPVEDLAAIEVFEFGDRVGPVAASTGSIAEALPATQTLRIDVAPVPPVVGARTDVAVPPITKMVAERGAGPLARDREDATLGATTHPDAVDVTQPVVETRAEDTCPSIVPTAEAESAWIPHATGDGAWPPPDMDNVLEIFELAPGQTAACPPRVAADTPVSATTAIPVPAAIPAASRAGVPAVPVLEPVSRPVTTRPVAAGVVADPRAPHATPSDVVAPLPALPAIASGPPATTIVPAATDGSPASIPLPRAQRAPTRAETSLPITPHKEPRPVAVPPADVARQRSSRRGVLWWMLAAVASGVMLLLVGVPFTRPHLFPASRLRPEVSAGSAPSAAAPSAAMARAANATGTTPDEASPGPSEPESAPVDATIADSRAGAPSPVATTAPPSSDVARVEPAPVRETAATPAPAAPAVPNESPRSAAVLRQGERTVTDDAPRDVRSLEAAPQPASSFASEPPRNPVPAAAPAATAPVTAPAMQPAPLRDDGERASTREATAVTPPPSPESNEVASPGRDPQADVREALSSYRAAYANLDAAAARRVWPSVDQAALSRAFSTLKSQRLEFDRCDIVMKGDAATAACEGRAVYVPQVGRQEPQVEPRSWRFTLRSTPSGWRIDRAEIQR